MPNFIAELPGLSVAVRELTVAEVRTWALAKEAGVKVDPLHWIVFDDCTLADLAFMSSNVTPEQLEAFGPTDLEILRAKAKVVNPHFFKAREMLTGISRIIRAEVESLGSTPS